MPEISFCLFDLKQLFKLFPKQDRELEHQIEEYERKAYECMAENRVKLFSQYGYQSEFDKVSL